MGWGTGGDGSPLPFPRPPHLLPESYIYTGDGRATVQQDTLVSIGNRCHDTFHLRLHTGRGGRDGGFLGVGVGGKAREGGGELRVRASCFFVSSCKIKKTSPCGPKRVFL